MPGERLLAAWTRIEPEMTLPRHHHQEKQIGVVLEGAIVVTIGRETCRVDAGPAYVVPPNVPHAGVTGSEGRRVSETFFPPARTIQTGRRRRRGKPHRRCHRHGQSESRPFLVLGRPGQPA